MRVIYTVCKVDINVLCVLYCRDQCESFLFKILKVLRAIIIIKMKSTDKYTLHWQSKTVIKFKRKSQDSTWNSLCVTQKS